MAKRQIISYTFTDDLTGEELSEDEAQTIEFSYGGSDYSIDLSNTNAKKLDDFLAPYVDAATKVRKSAGSSKAKTGSGETAADRDVIRKWARANGYTIGDRGRISDDIRNAYSAAH